MKLIYKGKGSYAAPDLSVSADKPFAEVKDEARATRLLSTGLFEAVKEQAREKKNAKTVGNS